jgi:putative membrane protein
MRNAGHGFIAAAVSIVTLTFARAAQAQPYGPGMMGQDGYGGFYGPIHMVIWAVVLIAIIAGVVWLVRSLALPGSHHLVPKRSSGLDLLDERYARGELNRDEYIQKKKDIGG